MKISATLRSAAFSLTEVVIAMGLITFSLLAIVGTLPAGLQATKNANEQAAAAEVLNRIAVALRHAPAAEGAGQASGGDGAAPATFETAFAGRAIRYTVGETARQEQLWNLTLEGEPARAGSPPRLRALLRIENSPSRSQSAPPQIAADTAGKAIVSVAWGAHPEMRWDSASGKWENAEGQITAPILFLPPAPPR